jgi:hypothetical protein
MPGSTPPHLDPRWNVTYGQHNDGVDRVQTKGQRGSPATSDQRREQARPVVDTGDSPVAAAGDDLSADDLSVSSVARAARVHRSFIYRHGDLHAAVHDQAASDTSLSDGTRASRQALRADLANALERGTRQAQRIRQLDKKLSHLLGDNAWRESGLGAPTDIDALQQKVTSLEQHLLDVKVQLAARDEDLNAARNANRELMAQLNHR